jgi:preprotein translocase SecE subunit
LASKDKKSATKKDATTTKVTRIVASDPAVPTKKVAKASAKKATPDQSTEQKAERRNPLKAISDYFRGAWYELRQVRWPNRRATWGLTVAVLTFTVFFVVLILLLDALFKYLFQIILG